MKLADLEFTIQGDTIILEVIGELDLSNSEMLERAITESIPNSSLVVVIDLTRLVYLDSAGIRLILRLHEQLRTRGQRMELVVCEGSPAHAALVFSGVASLVSFNPDLDAALERLAGDADRDRAG